MTYSYLTIASTYGAGAYDANNYNGTATSTSTGSGSSGTLSNTGIAIAGVVTIAAVLLLVAMAVRIWRRPSRKAQVAAVEADDSADK